MTDFALIGAAGFVAPRHMEAIAAVRGNLVAAMDLSDSVGVLDRYFPEAQFFNSPERFDRFLEKRRREGNPIDYVSICSPNHLHDAHVRQALRVGAHAICEKPLVISPWNLDALVEAEKEYGRRVYTVLQLRLLPEVRRLKEAFSDHQGPPAQVKLTYVTPRGPWYHVSWKGDSARSGGIAMNIGIHFFDLLCWVFGATEDVELVRSSRETVEGRLAMERADVRFLLSVDRRQKQRLGNGAERLIVVNGAELDLTPPSNQLHSDIYAQIVAGQGFGIEDARDGVELVHRLRCGA